MVYTHTLKDAIRLLNASPEHLALWKKDPQRAVSVLQGLDFDLRIAQTAVNRVVYHGWKA